TPETSLYSFQTARFGISCILAFHEYPDGYLPGLRFADDVPQCRPSVFYLQDNVGCCIQGDGKSIRTGNQWSGAASPGRNGIQLRGSRPDYRSRQGADGRAFEVPGESGDRIWQRSFGK